MIKKLKEIYNKLHKLMKSGRVNKVAKTVGIHKPILKKDGTPDKRYKK